MVQRILILVAAVTVGVFGVATVAGAGGGQGNGQGNSNPNANNTGADPSDPPVEGCQPVNVPRKGEGRAIDDPRCPGYNGNAENTFTLSTSSPTQGVPFTASGGWCAPTSTVNIRWDVNPLGGSTTNLGTFPVGANRKFTNVSLTIPTSAPSGAGNIVAICSTSTRTAPVTVIDA